MELKNIVTVSFVSISLKLVEPMALLANTLTDLKIAVRGEEWI